MHLFLLITSVRVLDHLCVVVFIFFLSHSEMHTAVLKALRFLDMNQLPPGFKWQSWRDGVPPLVLFLPIALSDSFGGSLSLSFS